MASAGRTCLQCGSDRVEEDDLYSEAQWVCQDCGCVAAEGRLVTDTGEGTADVRYSQTTAVSKVPCRNQIKGLQRVRALCRILRLSSEMEELAEDFYRRSYSHASFLRLSLQKKEALVGCCVLVSCRLRNWPIAMGSITCLLETDPALVGGVYQELLKILDVDVPKTSITDILEAHCREYKLGSADVPEELAESSKDLATRSVALVELAADSWIVTGRHPIPIMMASIFLSWQSLKPTKIRLKYSLNKFCQLSKMPMNKTAMTRVAEMKEVLWKLGQELPWQRVGEEMAPVDVLRNVADILQHRYALLRAALQTHEETLQTHKETHKETLGTGIQPSTEDLRPEQGELKSVTGDSDEEDSLAPAAHWGKRMLFAPPCVRHPKIRRVDTAERADVNGDEEISDSEIDSYIRTPQEMRDYVQTQNALLSEDAQSKGE